MTAADLAGLMGKHRWRKGQKVRCPAHPDRDPSLSIRDGDKGVMVRCQSRGCNVEDICSAIGIRVSDLFYEKTTPRIRARTARIEQMRSLERQSGLVAVLGAIDKGKRAYWLAAERRIEAEIQELRPLLEPEKVFQEWRERMFQKRINKYGWDEMWRQVK